MTAGAGALRQASLGNQVLNIWWMKRFGSSDQTPGWPVPYAVDAAYSTIMGRPRLSTDAVVVWRELFAAADDCIVGTTNVARCQRDCPQ